MDLQLITNDMVVASFGDRHDGLSVWKGTKRVGYLSDLRAALGRNKSKSLKQKEYNNRVSEERREKLPEAVQEMKSFLESYLSNTDAVVFINISQPNVHINGHKCYIIVDPIYEKHQLGIMHKELTYDDMASLIPSFSCSSSTSRNHILFRGLSSDDIINTIFKLCR